MGRITGSASIETLVRVGIEKEHGLSPDSKMVVLHDFTPCVDDELEVKRGQIVNILYRENDWVYVIGQDTRQEGFIPHSYCAPFNTQLADLAIKKKLPRDLSTMGAPGGGGVGVNVGGGSGGGGGTGPGTTGLVVGGGGLGNGVGLTAADLTDGGMPDISMDVLDDSTGPGLLTNALKHSQASLSSEPDFLPFAKDPSGRYIVLYTFIARDENDVSVERGEFVTVLNREDPEWFWIAQAPDDLSVRRGDWIYADLNNQTVDGWLWAYAPKTRKYGFIPKAYARPPAMTSL
uniref:SH3 domain-containing protein n=1 Tax=Anopheles melas TaxID=34690 RepID=A0A182U307_9DIPT